jgi:hypothetical protein
MKNINSDVNGIINLIGKIEFLSNEEKKEWFNILKVMDNSELENLKKMILDFLSQQQGTESNKNRKYKKINELFYEKLTQFKRKGIPLIISKVEENENMLDKIKQNELLNKINKL